MYPIFSLIQYTWLNRKEIFQRWEETIKMPWFKKFIMHLPKDFKIILLLLEPQQHASKIKWWCPKDVRVLFRKTHLVWEIYHLNYICNVIKHLNKDTLPYILENKSIFRKNDNQYVMHLVKSIDISSIHLFL